MNGIGNVGNTFIDVFDAEATKIQDVRWLAQDTIYLDVIESAGADTGKAHSIKSSRRNGQISLCTLSLATKNRVVCHYSTTNFGCS